MDFHLPELGEGVYEAELIAWLVKPGDTIRRGQSLMEVMTDKATMEVPSPFAGKVDEFKAQPGQQIKVGDVMLTYSAAGERGDGAATSASKTAKAPNAKKESAAPQINGSEGEEEPEESASGDGAATPARPKPARTTSAKKESAVVQANGGAEEEESQRETAKKKAPAGAGSEALGRNAGPYETERSVQAKTTNGEKPAPAAFPESVKAAPSVRLMARKLGIDLTRVQGTGPEGRILVGDLSSAVRPATAGQPSFESPAPTADYGKPGTRIKLQGVRRKIAEHMVLAKRTIPHYSYVDECDVTEMARLRESFRSPYAKKGVKLTYLAFIVKAAAIALKEVPIVNASLDEAAGEIVLHDHYHIGIAVATPRGLIVPVVRDADKRDLVEIAREIDRLSADARTGKVKLEDLRGSTFTVTSIGGIGGLISTPIINHPEVAILGVGKIVKRPVFDTTKGAGNLAIRPADLVFLSFCFDHRVVDGAVGAAFGNAIIQQLQAPAGLMVS